MVLPSMSVEQRTSEIAAPLIKVVDENSPNATRKRSFGTIKKISLFTPQAENRMDISKKLL